MKIFKHIDDVPRETITLTFEQVMKTLRFVKDLGHFEDFSDQGLDGEPGYTFKTFYGTKGYFFAPTEQHPFYSTIICNETPHGSLEHVANEVYVFLRDGGLFTADVPCVSAMTIEQLTNVIHNLATAHETSDIQRCHNDVMCILVLEECARRGKKIISRHLKPVAVGQS